MFLTALGSLSGFRRPIAVMLSSQNASHALIRFDTRIYAADDIRTWWAGSERVESVTPLLPTVTTINRPVYAGKELGANLILTERPRTAMTQDRLEFMEGTPEICPAPGEIWLASSTARAAGLHPGDVLEISTDQGIQPFKISGVVVDPQYSSGFVQPERAWVAPGELASLYPPGALHNYTLGIRLHDPGDLNAVWNDFNRFTGKGFTGGYTPLDAIVNSYSFMVDMLGMLVLAFGVLSLLVALFIISSTISGEILANYRTFGILKSLGYTPRNVVAIFQLQFLLIALAALPVGIIGSYFTTRTMLELMLASIGTARVQLDFLGPATLTFFILSTLVVLAAGMAGGKAGRIKPASSIRFGAPEESVTRRQPFHLRLARYLPLSLVIGLKNLVSGKRRELYDLISISVTAFVLLFSINVFNSMLEMKNNMPFWGLDGSDVTIKRSDSIFGVRYKTLKQYLMEDPNVVIAGGNSSVEVTIPAGSNGPARKVSGDVVDGNLDTFGFINLTGRNPVNPGEISVGISLAEKYGLALGDAFEVLVRGQPQTFTVMGIFQSTNQGGYTFRTTLESIRKTNPYYEPPVLTVVLAEGADREAFMQTMEAGFGQAVDVEPREKLVEAQVTSVTQSLGMVLGFLSLIFLLVSAVSIFNSTAMGINETKRHYGIYKAIGYTQAQVRLMIVSKSAVLGLAAVAVGCVLFWTLTRTIMALLMTQMGMAQFPMVISPVGSMMMLPTVIALCVISAWLPSNRIARIKARELIVE
ncbi:MAG: FtsX-like permease family protein [Deltaproteobacteria bacterium]|nr:FtsX-like permease family protein [Deltaproteobacteria bacterium]